MKSPSKALFLSTYGFPPEWETWGLYPDALFHGDLVLIANDVEPHPHEHLRYGAFLWWLRRHRNLSEETLTQLGKLAALDTDYVMAGAAVHDILFHPNATARVVAAIAEAAQGHEAWRSWFKEIDLHKFFVGMLEAGRQFWAEREIVHRLAIDLGEGRLGESELRTLYATGGTRVPRALVEHPNLPHDLLLELAELQSAPSARQIRAIAKTRLAGKRVAPTGFAEKYATDPWSWSW